MLLWSCGHSGGNDPTFHWGASSYSGWSGGGEVVMRRGRVETNVLFQDEMAKKGNTK